jgi:hypothetical protein
VNPRPAKPLPPPGDDRPPEGTGGRAGTGRPSQGNLARPRAGSASTPSCAPCHLVAALQALAERLRADAAAAEREGGTYGRATYYRGRYGGEAHGLRRAEEEVEGMLR